MKSDPFTADVKDALQQSAQPTLRGQALRLLARRDWSRQALRERLQSYVTGEEGVAQLEALIDEFSARGWLSDVRYAEAVVDQRKNRYGKAAIERRLKQSGVNEAAIAQAVQAMDADHEFNTAVKLWQRKFGAPPKDDKEKARQIRFLQSRGYGLSVALRVLKTTAP